MKTLILPKYKDIIYEKMKEDDIMKEEKGSITLFVLTAMIFLVIVIAGMYMNFRNKQTAQERNNDKIVKEYQEEVDKMDQIYEQKVEEI